jgi:hypothetical protein
MQDSARLYSLLSTGQNEDSMASSLDAARLSDLQAFRVAEQVVSGLLDVKI